MRKIERQMNFAISNKGNWSSSNTRVEYNDSSNCSSESEYFERYGTGVYVGRKEIIKKS